jgi:hypothetical protein
MISVPDKLELASKPKHDPSSQTVSFEFWDGNRKRAGSIELPSMTSDEAMRFFNANWAAIVGMAARTAPMNGEIKLTLCS